MLPIQFMIVEMFTNIDEININRYIFLIIWRNSLNGSENYLYLRNLWNKFWIILNNKKKIRLGYRSRIFGRNLLYSIVETWKRKFYHI
jgi:hypothetical protein